MPYEGVPGAWQVEGQEWQELRAAAVSESDGGVDVRGETAGVAWTVRYERTGRGLVTKSLVLLRPEPPPAQGDRREPGFPGETAGTSPIASSATRKLDRISFRACPKRLSPPGSHGRRPWFWDGLRIWFRIISRHRESGSNGKSRDPYAPSPCPLPRNCGAGAVGRKCVTRGEVPGERELMRSEVTTRAPPANQEEVDTRPPRLPRRTRTTTKYFGAVVLSRATERDSKGSRAGSVPSSSRSRPCRPHRLPAPGLACSQTQSRNCSGAGP